MGVGGRVERTLTLTLTLTLARPRHLRRECRLRLLRRECRPGHVLILGGPARLLRRTVLLRPARLLRVRVRGGLVGGLLYPHPHPYPYPNPYLLGGLLFGQAHGHAHTVFLGGLAQVGVGSRGRRKGSA